MAQAEFHEMAELTHYSPAHPMAIYGTLFMMLGLLFSMLVLLPLGGLVGHRFGFYEPGDTSAILSYQKAKLAVGSEITREQAKELLPVAISEEGIYLFATAASSGGGAGALPVTDAPLSRYGRLYVKTASGQYYALNPAR